jgi:hypothetical protein
MAAALLLPELPIRNDATGRVWLAKTGGRCPAANIFPPHLRPRHACHCQEHDHAARKQPRYGVKVAPKYPALRRAARGQDFAAAPPRPPEKNTREGKNNGPPRRYFDEAARPKAEILQTVNLAHNLHDAAFGDRSDDAAVIGINEGGPAFSRGSPDQHFHGIVRLCRHGHPQDIGLRLLRRFLHECACSHWRAARGHVFERAIEDVVDLRREQIKSPRHGQIQQERQRQEPGEEMPAPHGAVKRGLRRRRVGINHAARLKRDGLFRSHSEALRRTSAGRRDGSRIDGMSRCC